MTTSEIVVVVLVGSPVIGYGIGYVLGRLFGRPKG